MTEKAKFLHKFNEAFAKSDTKFIIDSVTDDIEWTIYGDKKIIGKEVFSKVIETMASDAKVILEVDKIITHGDMAAVNGIITMPDKKQYAYSDIYKLSGFKNPKVKQLQSYIISLKNE